MTKKELFENVSNAVAEFCSANGVPAKVVDGLGSILEAHLAPKVGGVSVNVEDVTKVDSEGNVTHLLCSLSGVFLPATVEFFYEDKDGKGINGLRRLSRQAEAIRKQAAKVLASTERAIMQDVLAGAITTEEAKAQLEEARAAKPDYSAVSAN